MTVVVRSSGLSSGAVLALKLLAFGIMVVGHADWWLYREALGVHATLGRVVFPVFGFVLAWHLRGVTDASKLWRVCRRLAIFAAICTPLYMSLAGQGALLNILWTYAVAASVIALAIDGRYTMAAWVFALLPMFVDYQWTGVAGVVICWWWFKTAPRFDVVPLVVFAALLSGQFGNLWPLLSVPLVVATQSGLAGVDAPRLKWAFYVAYPAHLAAIWLLAAFSG